MPHFIWLIITYSRSLAFCLRYLPVREAIKVPIMVMGVKIGRLRKGDVMFSSPVRRGMVVLGFKGTEGRNARKTYLSVRNGGRITFGDGVTISAGTMITVDGGTMTFGNNFFCNANCFFNSTMAITFGDDDMLGWDIDLNTTDGHTINGNDPYGDIVIGNHVWLCSGVHVSKNVNIADGCVVAQKSLVTKSFNQSNMLIGGMPAKVIKENVSWRA